jgi:O-antigen ligase
MGELGLIGAVTFVAMFYWYFRRLRLHPPPESPDPDADKWARTLSAAGIGMAVCMCFLSRQYTMFVYILLAMGAAHAALIRAERPEPSTVPERLAAIALGFAMVPTLYVVTRVLVQFD